METRSHSDTVRAINWESCNSDTVKVELIATYKLDVTTYMVVTLEIYELKMKFIWM